MREHPGFFHKEASLLRLQSAIFDLDGTLLDSTGFWNTFSHEMLSVPMDQPALDLRPEFRRRTIREAAVSCKVRFGFSQSVEELTEIFENRVMTFYLHEVQPKPHVQEFLSILKMEGVWMYVATEAERTMAMKALQHTGLWDFFRGMLTCREIGHDKSTPEIYEGCMRRLRSNKRDTVVFEDSLRGIRTAKAAGFRVAAVYDPASEPDRAEILSLADYYIRSYDEMFQANPLD